MREHQIQAVSAHGNVFGLYFGLPKSPCAVGLDNAWRWTSSPRPGWPRQDPRRSPVSWTYPGTHVVAISGATAEIIRQQFPRLDPQRLQIIHPLHGLREAALARLPLPTPAPPWHLGFHRPACRKRENGRWNSLRWRETLAPVLDFKLHVFGDGPLPCRTCARPSRRDKLASRFILHGYWDEGQPGHGRTTAASGAHRPDRAVSAPSSCGGAVQRPARGGL